MVGRQPPPPPPPRPRWLVVVLVIAGVGVLCAGTGIAVHLAHRPDGPSLPPLPSSPAAVERPAAPAVQPGFKHALAPTLVFSAGPQPSFHPISPMRSETCTVSVTRQGVTSWLAPESLQSLLQEGDPPTKPIDFYTSIEIELQVDPKYMCDRERTDVCSVKVMRCGQPLYVTPALAAVLLPEPGNDGSVPADPVLSVKTAEPDAIVAPPEVRPDFVPDYDARWGDDKATRPLVWRTGTDPDLDKRVEHNGPGKVLENGDVLFERDRKAAEAAAAKRVRRAPVIPDDLGLGERLVIIDVLVERFGHPQRQRTAPAPEALDHGPLHPDPGRRPAPPGPDDPPAPMSRSIPDAIDAFIRHGQSRGWQPISVETAAMRLGVVVRLLAKRGCQRLADVTPADLDAVMAALRDQQRASDPVGSGQSVNRSRSARS